ncbi:MAG: CoA-binding protein [Dehalococcoidales bacterium]|nr:CoA-binding protein [Dehalococcoidales bacterium]
MVSDTIADLERIFHPRSVSIIGASSREGSFGRLFLAGFIAMGFKEIYPVHPREKELLGLKAYPGIKDIPCDIDLAILLIPQGEAQRIVRECAEKGVKGIVLFTAGFREKSEEGRAQEQEMVRIAREKGARLIGPNTNGLYCPAARLCTLPSSLIAGGLTTESGKLSTFAQSGSFNDYLCLSLTQKRIRLSKAVSSGNESDLTAVDYLEYFGVDPETRMIAGYMEGIKDGRGLYEVCRRICPEKPIILWKGGKTESGAKAALAHTGALAGSSQVWEAMFKQAGITSVSSFEEMVDCILAFYWLPLPQGKRVAIISGMGGTNIGTADNCINLGLEIARFSEETLRRLGELIKSAGTSIANPLDLGVGSLLSPQHFAEAAIILSGDSNVDMLLVITAPENPRSIAILAEKAGEIKKPMAVSLFDVPELIVPQFRYLLDRSIPVYTDPRRAAVALSKLAEYAEFRKGLSSSV